MDEELSQPTKHASKIIISILLIMKATFLDTYGIIVMKFYYDYICWRFSYPLLRLYLYLGRLLSTADLRAGFESPRQARGREKVRPSFHQGWSPT